MYPLPNKVFCLFIFLLEPFLSPSLGLIISLQIAFRCCCSSSSLCKNMQVRAPDTRSVLIWARSDLLALARCLRALLYTTSFRFLEVSLMGEDSSLREMEDEETKGSERSPRFKEERRCVELKGSSPLASSHITFPFFSSPAGLHGVTSACKFDKG